ncbi:MAG: response regulator transcription factor [Anaerolineales bacterium]
MTAKILIVDDEPLYLRLLEESLKLEKYDVFKAENGHEAIEVVSVHHPDLVVMDVMMPDMDGFTACKSIREFSNVPIIMLTSKAAERDRVTGLDLGADDYIVKPFSGEEFLARVRAALRRAESNKASAQQEVLSHGDLSIDVSRAEVYVGGKLVFLSATEYRLLLHLAHNIGKVLTSEELLTNVWGDEYRDDKEILWVSISRLRQKLEEDPKQPRHIVTRSGMGYSMPLN